VEPRFLIVPGKSLGPVRLGMTADEVRQLLGKRELFTNQSPDGSRYLGFSASGTSGFRVAVKDDRVIWIFIWLDGAYRTAEGIGNGSDALTVEKTYGMLARSGRNSIQVGLRTIPVLVAGYAMGLTIAISTVDNIVLYMAVHEPFAPN
jgi:hypothetical protein